ncbi:hypothetical protein [Microbacterium sp. Clip185]|uniref:hypothetical protein n=1 Tax=Microbacterium sp. Clip185 TaxID=3025663 RepID=UPI002365BFF0|nr:hypothetical protein [Microbacterium sp. Clip185]WDG18071.1 hypothetical protein PQV94_15815 [Microbacterium sp. Clip185]
MSFDIAVFDPAGAPRDVHRLQEWFDAQIGTAPAASIAAWEREMRQSFRGYEDAPEELPPGGRYADYGPAGQTAILHCAWDAADELEPLVWATAARHSLAVWAYSTAADRVWWPPTESFEDAPHPGLVLRTETLGTHEAPSDALIAAAVSWIDDVHGPGYVILESSSGDYAQTAGGRAGLTVEWRRQRRGLARIRGFWHGVAATDADTSGPDMRLARFRASQSILANELLGVDDARRIMIDFAHGEQPTAVYAWHDITDTFTKR